jgi:hypothetical protein
MGGYKVTPSRFEATAFPEKQAGNPVRGSLGASTLDSARSPVPHSIVIPLHCPKCRQPMSVSLRMPDGFSDTAHVDTITCPYADCGERMQPWLNGTITKVWAGHGPKPDTAQSSHAGAEPPLPTRSCPFCSEPAPRMLTALSAVAWDVNYYRCNRCGHVWTVTKDGTRIVSTVTISHEPYDPKRQNR